MTSYENLESICENGLIPSRGKRTASIGDKRNAVFLSKGMASAILMYVSLMHHYDSFTGEKGLRTLKHYQKNIEDFERRTQKERLDQEDMEEWKATIEAVEWIKEIMKYQSFLDYLGDGVYLSISDITNVNETNETDCYTMENISPEHMKVLVLKDKKTGEKTDFRENILAYFMSMTSSEELLKNIRNVVTIKRVKELYESKQNEIIWWNSNNFELEEIPIDVYLEKTRKRKNKK